MTDTAPLLAIDTATNQLALALYFPDTNTSKTLIEPAQRGGERLHQALEDLMAQANITLSDVQAIVIAIGPGSFTGIRVGLSAAQGLAHVLEVPVVGVSNMVAQGTPHAPITLINEAHGGQVYLQEFSEDGTVGQVESVFAEDALPQLAGRVGGNAVFTYREHIAEGCEVIENTDQADPALLAQLGWQQLQQHGKIAPPQPLYVKPLTYKKLSEQGSNASR